MRVILAADAVHRPLTGIGRYALELARQLRQMPEIEQLDFFAFGRWPQWDQLLAAEYAQTTINTATSTAAANSKRTLRGVLAGNALAVRAYQL